MSGKRTTLRTFHVEVAFLSYYLACVDEFDLKTALNGQVRQQRDFGNARENILWTKDGLDTEMFQRVRVGAQVEPAMKDVGNAGRNVRDHPDPTDPRAPPARTYNFTDLIGE
jgi:hypothetical protein